MKTISASKVSDNCFELDSPIILEQTSNTRRIFHGQVVKKADGTWAVRGWIVAQRKGRGGWSEIGDARKISELKGDELLKMELRTDHVRKLHQGLTALMDAAEIVGLTGRRTKLVVGREEELLRVPDREHKVIIEKLIEAQKGSDFWQLLVQLEPDLASQLADGEIQRSRRRALEVFQKHLEALDWQEREWEEFFENNLWIFGYGLRYQFLSRLQNQAHLLPICTDCQDLDKPAKPGTHGTLPKYSIVVHCQKSSSL